MKNLDYRGWESTTLRLVLLVFFIGTILLIADKINGDQWITGIIGIVASYVIKESVSKASEAYRDRNGKI
ncbi:hypothetical protein LCGC14_2887600 [marine sediment metagenome]|uniref:Uncharacterized protein n=1 Tax=marine sediment metagenome TaxID=412755 RepID=A0A0F8XYH2_9ZZZZ